MMPANAAVAGARDAGRDTDGDQAAERTAEPAADGACCVVPHPAANAPISRPPHAVTNDFFIFIELASLI
jgi:hypothetical protein